MNEFEYKGFTYSSDDSILGDKESIKGKSSEPPKLYKYYSYNNFSIDALRNQYLYASHPYQFNDSMDSSWALLDFNKMTENQYDRIWSQIKGSSFYEKNIKGTYSKDKWEVFEHTRQMFYAFWMKNRGFISLTSTHNPLMWAHYSSERGFAIVLNTESLRKNIVDKNKDIYHHFFAPIQYVEKIESIDMFEGFNSPHIPFLIATNVKRYSWSYENEWRLRIYKRQMDIPQKKLLFNVEDVKGEYDRKVYYGREPLEAILLGKYFFCGENTRSFDGKSRIIKLKCKTKKDIDFIRFINYLHFNFNDRLYLAGELNYKGTFGRDFTRTQLERIDFKTFRIVDCQQLYPFVEF
ncbi:Protein of unknown function (DUF2971) [Capnocytophaga leadbetteri]|uniref:DUF2971 family protein n=1 Tax=Capnocytophaga leadbetteri TaxID=327575 RepID=A0A2T5XYB4_9FLAO|nr:DUF2971 domain-containing protein [Capnocytophaga leadbetteri]PTX08514.1 Protein of unknown function (DUF2971) [Capnocytophaga leadbetteri]